MKRALFLIFIASAGIAVADQTTAPSIELKKRSTFSSEGAERNPFWPIGWKPAARVTNASDNAGTSVPASAFRVTSITLDPGAHYAIINGKIMMEGQQFGLQLGTQIFQITVKAIEDGRIVLTRRDEEIIVPLHRK